MEKAGDEKSLDTVSLNLHIYVHIYIFHELQLCDISQSLSLRSGTKLQILKLRGKVLHISIARLFSWQLSLLPGGLF
jgi:hypothetical protein